MKLNNEGWEVYDYRTEDSVGRKWTYTRRKRHASGYEVQFVKGETGYASGPSGEFLEHIHSSYFIPSSQAGAGE